MTCLVPEELQIFPLTDAATDFTPQLSDPEKLGTPCGSGSFGEVFQYIVETSNGKVKVAVKVFKIDSSRATDKIENAIRRELKVWLRLKHQTVVPLLGFAYVNSSSKFPALVSQWMPSGTLSVYLKEATIMTAFAKVALVKGVAAGLDYLQSMNVVHGDLHPGNVLIDGSGNPCLTDFGLATIEGEVDLELNSTTVERSFNSRWRAPEVLGVESECNPQKPTFMSDIYSFGGIMFYIVSGDIPWKEKKHVQICVALSHKVLHARPENIIDDHWNLIQKCWSWEAGHRPKATNVLQYIDQFRIDNWQGQQPKVLAGQGLVDLMGQIDYTTAEHVSSGDFGIVFKCDWIRPEGLTKVAVKVIRLALLEPDLQKFRHVAESWAALMHDNIVPVFGATREFGSFPALVLPWFQNGTLLHLIAEQGTALNIMSKLILLHGAVSGLRYLHGLGIVHGNITSSNVLVDIKEEKYVARLTDFGLATIFGGCLGDRIFGSNVRTGAIRWIAPELLKAHDRAPTMQTDMYSFGRVMFHVLTLVIPWSDMNDSVVSHKILGGENISRPATPDMMTVRWNEIAQCWSSDASTRPSAKLVMDFLRSEIEALAGAKISVGGLAENHSNAQASTSELPPLPEIQLALAEDLTGQIFGGIKDYVASGAFANVYKCEWRKPSSPVKKVAVKTFGHHMIPISEQDLRRFRRETAIWAHLIHDNIVALYGTTEGFGPTTALVSQWFPDGTLSHLIREQGTTLTIKSKLKLLHGIASGLYYLHSIPIVHGDIASSNVLVDLKEGEYKACLTDFGLSNVLRGRLKKCQIEESTVRPGAIRWTAPELLGSRDSPSDIKPTTQNDMYSFGRVMFHLLTLIIPWYDIDEYKVTQKIQNGEDISRPEASSATSDVTDARWGHIERCWSIDPPARPCALTAMNFITGELEALNQDNVLAGEVQESHQDTNLFVEQSSLQTLVPSRRNTVPSSPLTHHLFSTVSSLSLGGPLNVLLFGETGVGKSSIINLIMGRNVAQTSPDQETCTLQHTSHEVDLAERRFKLWEVSSIESTGSFRTFLAKRRLEKSYKKLYKDDGVHLLLYCMRGSRAQRALIKDYKFFTDIVGSTATAAGSVPVAAVVTCLEDYPMDMDVWWTKNKDNLERLGMRFSAHACITSLPDDPTSSPAMRARRQRSEEVIRRLIYGSYRTGTETPRSSSPL